MPGKAFEYKPFISIASGDIVKKVTDPETPGARKREWTVGGRAGVSLEVPYKSWEGVIENIIIYDGEFGEVCHVYFEDAILSMPTKSRYFTDFAKKIMGADLSQSIEISPFDFEDDKKRRHVGVTLKQGAKKLENQYWNTETNAPVEGFPVPKGDTKKFNSDKWAMYYLTVKEFLVEEIRKNLAFMEKEEDFAPLPTQNFVVDKEQVSVESVPF